MVSPPEDEAHPEEPGIKENTTSDACACLTWEGPQLRMGPQGSGHTQSPQASELRATGAGGGGGEQAEGGVAEEREGTGEPGQVEGLVGHLEQRTWRRTHGQIERKIRIIHWLLLVQ